MEQLNNIELLLKTADAGRYLGVSVQSLRRYRDVEGGFLVENEDWFSGAFENSPIRWNVQSCKEAFSKRRKGFSTLKRFQEAKKILKQVS